MKFAHIFSTILIVLGIFSTNANALTVGRYKELKTSQLEQLKLYISGVSQGLFWSNAIAKNKFGDSFYCEPQDLAPTIESYLGIIDTAISSGKYHDADVVEYILYVGLNESYPCEDK